MVATGGSSVGGVNVAFLCAVSVDAGQLTIPSYVLLNLPPTGASTVPGGLGVGNTSLSLFTASGLDFGKLLYGVTYTLNVKYQ